MNQSVDSALVNGDNSVVTVWSDIGCPWATLALHTLTRAADRRGVDLIIDHRSFPLELFNHRPTPKPITDAEVVAIAGYVRDLDWRQWSEPAWSFAVTTLPAMEAVQACKDEEVGGLRASTELDRALRHAFYVDHLCISILPIILDVARSCPHVNYSALEAALRMGRGRTEIFDQWAVAQRPEIICSPHLLTATGLVLSNPGAKYQWSGAAESGFPRLNSYDAAWADEVLDSLTQRRT